MEKEEWLADFLLMKDKFNLNAISLRLGVPRSDLVKTMVNQGIEKIPIQDHNPLLLEGPVYDENEFTWRHTISLWLLTHIGPNRFKQERYLRDLGGVLYKDKWLRIYYATDLTLCVHQKLQKQKGATLSHFEVQLAVPHLNEEQLIFILLNVWKLVLIDGVWQDLALKPKNNIVAEQLAKARAAKNTYGRR